MRQSNNNLINELGKINTKIQNEEIASLLAIMKKKYEKVPLDQYISNSIHVDVLGETSYVPPSI